ncbi:hypothetical protein HJA82_28880 [Rhizobium bangladeshense]|uniref:hypothetical protein n=1 Tax=Rhizobium bangladeshense TaxID=1138189 RepID=UPI001C82B055|nr:hypothetical protein [Rhizobium bangladeshense]MBX4911328.1 hypothetical protein [Rhizobium bangladeshense]
MDIHFNTGRRYTTEGQVIRAVWDKENEVIHFADLSRAVNGSIEAPEWEITFTTPGGLARFVMERYDRHVYKNSLPSFELLMMKGRDPNATIHQFGL